MIGYQSVAGILMPFEGPPEPPPSWLPNVSDEQEAAAADLYRRERPAGLMVTFQFQPAAVREPYLRRVGWAG